jgi:6-phosphogluconolactonase (cycloisomerase 2 family)
MKFTKFGKALLMSALSAGVILSVTSCVQSYTVGFLYVTGTVTAQSNGNGIISGFKIDHNTGQLRTVNGLPISSGGSNPVRAVLIQSSRFLYVLNRGVTASGGSDCTSTDPCQNANITQFAVGANGILTPQETFFTQGINPFRMLSDSSGNYLFVLDHDSSINNLPSSTSNPNSNCALALGNDSNGNPITTCGDITVFSVNATTGRLTLVVNAAVTAATGGGPLAYFPVPSYPVDFMISSTSVLTLNATAATASADYPYVGGSTVFPYTYPVNGGGQLTRNQNTSQPLNIKAGTAITVGGGTIYVLDNEPIYVNGSTTPASNSQLLPYSLGTNGSLNALTSGPVPDDSTQENPIALVVESKTKWLYLANQGNNNNTTGAAESGITGYVIDPSQHTLSQMAGLPFGTGSGPQCIVEDPSDQYIYTANYNDSTVTGQSIDQQAGVLRDLTKASSFALTGPATYCLTSGRTN